MFANFRPRGVYHNIFLADLMSKSEHEMPSTQALDKTDKQNRRTEGCSKFKVRKHDKNKTK